MKKGLLLLLLIPVFSVFAQENSEFSKMSFLIGEWQFDAQSLMPDGSYQAQTFYSKVEPLFGGHAHKDDFYFKNQDGDLVIYGTTIRSYDSQSSKWKMLWYNYNLSQITEMVGEYRNNEFHFEAEGKDVHGDYIEKITFYDISDGSYSWKGDKSYDNGKTWLKNFFAYTAKKMESKTKD